MLNPAGNLLVITTTLISFDKHRDLMQDCT
jgi:hypothetical protein